MLPISQQQLQRRIDFQTFLLNGFLDVDQLPDAILTTNNMTDEETQQLKEDMERFNNFLKRATATEVIPEMVIMNPQDLAFSGFRKAKGLTMANNADQSQSFIWEPREPLDSRGWASETS
jgi:hypothetical protein